MHDEVTAVDVPARYHPRVTAGMMVKIARHGRISLAKAKDVSMAGVFLIGLRAEEDERVVVTLQLPDDGEVTTYCRVTRRHPQGVAVEFEDLDWDDLFVLARFLHPRLP